MFFGLVQIILQGFLQMNNKGTSVLSPVFSGILIVGFLTLFDKIENNTKKIEDLHNTSNKVVVVCEQLKNKEVLLQSIGTDCYIIQHK